MKIDKTSAYRIVFIAMIVLGVILLIKSKFQTDHVANPPTEQVQTVTAVKYSEITVDKSNDYGTVKGVYPNFENIGNMLNMSISAFVDLISKEHLGIAEENWKARIDTGSGNALPDTAEKFPLEISYEIAQANSEFVSALVRYGGYQGGAHGYQNTVSFNYDVVNQKIMSLSDLFPEDANYLETLSSFSKANLTDLFTSKEGTQLDEFFQDMIDAGTAPTLENYQVFTFTNDMLTIYFGEYQVAPYVYGPQKVEFPL